MLEEALMRPSPEIRDMVKRLAPKLQKKHESFIAAAPTTLSNLKKKFRTDRDGLNSAIENFNDELRGAKINLKDIKSGDPARMQLAVLADQLRLYSCYSGYQEKMVGDLVKDDVRYKNLMIEPYGKKGSLRTSEMGEALFGDLKETVGDCCKSVTVESNYPYDRSGNIRSR